MVPIKILETIKKDGYEIRREEYSGADYGVDENIILEMAYTPNGDFIGDPNEAKALVEKLGIAPEKSDPNHSVCSIGWSEKVKNIMDIVREQSMGLKLEI